MTESQKYQGALYDLQQAKWRAEQLDRDVAEIEEAAETLSLIANAVALSISSPEVSKQDRDNQSRAFVRLNTIIRGHVHSLHAQRLQQSRDVANCRERVERIEREQGRVNQ